MAAPAAPKIPLEYVIMDSVTWTGRTFHVQVRVPPVRESMVVVMAIHRDRRGDVET